MPLGGDEGIGHAAADDERVDLFQQVADDIQLVRDLCATENRDKGGSDRPGFAHDGHFLLHEEAADSRQIIRHAGRGGMGAVPCRMHKDLRQRSQLLDSSGSFFVSALHEADVLQQHHIAVLQGRGLGLASSPTTSLAITTGLPSSSLQGGPQRPAGTARVLPLALRLAHMGAKDDAGAVVDKVLNGRHGSDDALVARDLAFLWWGR